ncbi:MAG: insulinase family protein [Ignavibacteriales bacterium]|nr:insulinase family protein [Ignavibacteriales bacterium]
MVGDTTMAEIKPKLEKLFAGLEAAATAPEKNIAAGRRCRRSRSSTSSTGPAPPQSVILAGHAAPPTANPDEIAIETMNTILGGDFVSRINMNIREDKHWSYGAQTLFLGTPAASGRSSPTRRCRRTRPRRPMVEIQQGARRHPGQEAHHRGRVRQRQEQHRPGAAGPVGDHGRPSWDRSRRWSSYGLPDDYYRKYPGPRPEADRSPT